MNKEIRSWFVGNKWILIPLAAILALILFFLFPLMDGIVLGMVFAYVGKPIRDHFKERKHLGSVVATICIITPIAIILGLGTIEIINQVIWLVEHQGEILRRLSLFITELEIPPLIYEELTGSLNNVIAALTTIAVKLPAFTYGRDISLIILNFIVSIPVCYFLLIDGERFVNACSNIPPKDGTDLYKKYIARIDSILSGIFIGSIYTALLGSTISAIVFFAFGIPRPFALASFVFIAGLVPILTAWLVIVPITAFRYFSIGPIDALTFFVVASLLMYLPTELIIRPYLVSTKSTLHPLLVMLPFLGGMLVAGIGGFFLAPALMGVIVGVYQVHQEEALKNEFSKAEDGDANDS